jgi:hypothetical protein
MLRRKTFPVITFLQSLRGKNGLPCQPHLQVRSVMVLWYSAVHPPQHDHPTTQPVCQ